MIRAFKGHYLFFSDEGKKRKGELVAIEILHKQMDTIQLIVCNETQLLVAIQVKEISEIAGYHQYTPLDEGLSVLGIGGLSRLRSDSSDGMLEGLAAQTHMNYQKLTRHFAKGLLEVYNNYICVFE